MSGFRTDRDHTFVGQKLGHVGSVRVAHNLGRVQYARVVASEHFATTAQNQINAESDVATEDVFLADTLPVDHLLGYYTAR